MKIEAFVIHLERASERRDNVARLVEMCPVPTHVVSAIDAQALSSSEIDAVYKKNLHQPRYPFTMTKGEVACFLSHRKVWQEILDRGLDGGLVFEDDVEIKPDLIAKVIAMLKSIDYRKVYIRFPHKPGSETGTLLQVNGEVQLIQPANPGLGTVGQFVGVDAASKLLEVSKAFDRPIDGIVQLRHAHGVLVLAALPGMVRDISANFGHSLIQTKKRKSLHNIQREVLRTLYRLRVRSANRK